MVEQLEPMPEDWDRALAIVAHPDDMEYGAAAAVARWTSDGRTVVYHMVSKGEAGIDRLSPAESGRLRAAEQIEACRAVGVATVEFGGHPDGVIEHTIELRRDLTSALRRHRPELVITLNHHDTWGDGRGGGWNSSDHRNVGRATLDAVGDAGNRWIFSELDLEPWRGIRWVAVAGSAFATHAVSVEGHIDAAVASLSAHEAYLAGLGDGAMTHPRAFIEEMVNGNAERFGGRPAVTFELFG